MSSNWTVCLQSVWSILVTLICSEHISVHVTLFLQHFLGSRESRIIVIDRHHVICALPQDETALCVESKSAIIAGLRPPSRDTEICQQRATSVAATVQCVLIFANACWWYWIKFPKPHSLWLALLAVHRSKCENNSCVAHARMRPTDWTACGSHIMALMLHKRSSFYSPFKVVAIEFVIVWYSPVALNVPCMPVCIFAPPSREKRKITISALSIVQDTP